MSVEGRGRWPCTSTSIQGWLQRPWMTGPHRATTSSLSHRATSSSPHSSNTSAPGQVWDRCLVIGSLLPDQSGIAVLGFFLFVQMASSTRYRYRCRTAWRQNAIRERFGTCESRWWTSSPTWCRNLKGSAVERMALTFCPSAAALG